MEGITSLKAEPSDDLLPLDDFWAEEAAGFLKTEENPIKEEILEADVKYIRNEGPKLSLEACSNVTNEREESWIRGGQKRRQDKKPVFHCSLCYYQTPVKDDLISHMKKHLGAKPFLCSQCDYSAGNTITLAIHMKKHRGRRKFDL